MGESKPVCEIVDGVLRAYNGSDANVIIPEGVTKIGEGAFKNNTTMNPVLFSSLICLTVSSC